MAMGKKPAARQPSPMWVATADLPTNAGHPFFERLNRVLEEAGFDPSSRDCARRSTRRGWAARVYGRDGISGSPQIGVGGFGAVRRRRQQRPMTDERLRTEVDLQLRPRAGRWPAAV